VESEEEEDAPERRGLWDGVDFHFSAIEQLMRESEREREKERETLKSTKLFSIKR